jgi:hypothetical protein
VSKRKLDKAYFAYVKTDTSDFPVPQVSFMICS